MTQVRVRRSREVMVLTPAHAARLDAKGLRLLRDCGYTHITFGVCEWQTIDDAIAALKRGP